MFHTGTATPQNKMAATEMQQELLIRSHEGEIEEADVPEVSTISNWISSFSRTWKRAMAELEIAIVLTMCCGHESDVSPKQSFSFTG
ncbi:hypothetical protein C2G38_2230640 [Gigaspora rosea]|uniref:Uncharacterized protein n=1 Tax=Gigaspora rosea TaxID=44941 RepID=A0A397U356_9GLOM|nr:hypothetical protein C2G38_2230640 [Gigaspora rosea]